MHSKLENAWNVADTIRISELAEQYWKHYWISYLTIRKMLESWHD